MLFPTKSAAGEFNRLVAEIQKPGCDPAAIARRLIAVDPNFAPAYITLALHHAEAGDLAEAESLLWKALELAPCSAQAYTTLAQVRLNRNDDDALARRLQHLAMWKLALMEEIPDAAANQYRDALEGGPGDPDDPQTYEVLATVEDLRLQKSPHPPEVEQRLLPYVLLNNLQREAPSVVAHETMSGIMEHAAECIPLLRGALRQWARGNGEVSDEAGFLSIALLGEIGEPDMLEDLLELAERVEPFLHVHWAIHRLAERHPEAALAAFAAVTGDASVGLRCGLAEHMYMMPAAPGIEDALTRLVDHFSRLSRHQDAPHLLLTVVEALSKCDRKEQAMAVLARCRKMLPKKEQLWIDEAMDSEEGFSPTLAREGLVGMDIEDVCLERVLMTDEEDEDEDEDEEDEDEEDEEDEEDDEDEEISAPPMSRVLADIGDSVVRYLSRQEQERAKILYFDTSGKVEADQDQIGGFLQWIVHDFRDARTGHTIIERYLADSAKRMNAAERTFVESLRDARFGFYEAESVEKGRGIHLRDVYTGQADFVHDVTASREISRGDAVISRIHSYDGEVLFVSDGSLVPAELLPRMRAWIAEESGAAGQPEGEFVRANSHRLHRVLRQLDREQRLAKLKVVNREGDTFEFCRANYRVLDEPALLEKLRGMKELLEHPDAKDPDAHQFGWLATGPKNAPRASYGHMEIRDGGLRLECNSRDRLKKGRRLLETRTGACLEHLGDTFESVSEAL